MPLSHSARAAFALLALAAGLIASAHEQAPPPGPAPETARNGPAVPPDAHIAEERG